MGLLDLRAEATLLDNKFYELIATLKSILTAIDGPSIMGEGYIKHDCQSIAGIVILHGSLSQEEKHSSFLENINPPLYGTSDSDLKHPA